jgi:predicted amidohydrolase
VPGPSTGQFGALAKKLGIYVTVPLVEIVRPPAGSDEDPKLFNTVALMSPKGELVAHYRKLHPWPVPEKSWATAGDRGIQTYDTEYGRVGLAICFDIHETVPMYKDSRLWALLYPIAWVDAEHPANWFWHELPDRVGKLGFYVIGANWSVDRPQAWRGYGFSTIISPQGKVLASATSLYGSQIVYAEIPTGPR